MAPKAPGGVSTVSAAKTSTEKPSPDPFAALREATLAHRAEHGCGAYPYDNGALLGALAAAANARRVLELGTALSYTALWFARGAPDAVIDTIERDGEHVRLAREQVEAHGMAGHIVVHEGEFADVLRRLDPGYDVAFFDGFTPSRPLLEGNAPAAAGARAADQRQSDPCRRGGLSCRLAREEVLAYRLHRRGTRNRAQH